MTVNLDSGPCLLPVVNLTEDRKETKKPNEFWSEWQDSNLRPLRPERSALPG
jgi:hypothetical protein